MLKRITQSFVLVGLSICLVGLGGCKRESSNNVVKIKNSSINITSSKHKPKNNQPLIVNLSSASMEEMHSLAQDFINNFDYYQAAKVYQKIQLASADSQQKSKALFAQAKCLFLSGDYSHGAVVFDKFMLDYPESKTAPEAKYLALVCKYNVAKKIPVGCDLKAVEDVLKIADNLLKDESLIVKNSEIKGIVQDCKERLLSKETENFDLYIRTGDFVSAKSRIEKIKDEYKGISGDFDAKTLYMESKLAKMSGQTELAKELAQKLAQEFPDSRFSKMARGLFEGLFV